MGYAKRLSDTQRRSTKITYYAVKHAGRRMVEARFDAFPNYPWGEQRVVGRTKNEAQRKAAAILRGGAPMSRLRHGTGTNHASGMHRQVRLMFLQ